MYSLRQVCCTHNCPVVLVRSSASHSQQLSSIYSCLVPIFCAGYSLPISVCCKCAVWLCTACLNAICNSRYVLSCNFLDPPLGSPELLLDNSGDFSICAGVANHASPCKLFPIERGVCFSVTNSPTVRSSRCAGADVVGAHSGRLRQCECHW
ncbi:hypothetical protein DFJ58DRAFT_863844 [Suillus subalutaceus]|uniref:uncharacterized protein n=1 Tax=Suillus subalutaceus TaxID=48586 RepID=UPI001B884CCC|nr:uncharacterized protein DFJ58DRAFT_863844 [Suillus subalutaceus]KAG1837119.1 hypothetical protein DFJ58DRAFT_863844 [Suillus subalutaceus]